MVDVEWTEGAIEDLRTLDAGIRKRILAKISWFAENFDKTVPEPLAGSLKGTFKFRIGDWRVIYSLGKETVTIRCVGHRREIYRT